MADVGGKNNVSIAITSAIKNLPVKRSANHAQFNSIWIGTTHNGKWKQQSEKLCFLFGALIFQTSGGFDLGSFSYGSLLSPTLIGVVSSPKRPIIHPKQPPVFFFSLDSLHFKELKFWFTQAPNRMKNQPRVEEQTERFTHRGWKLKPQNGLGSEDSKRKFFGRFFVWANTPED